MLRLLHISDFHIKNDNLFPVKNSVIKPLLDDLEDFQEDKKIDFVVCSGDMINAGGNGFDNIENAYRTFKDSVASKLIETLELSPARLIFTCGNHDISRKLDSDIAEKGILHSLTSPDSLNDYLTNGEKDGSKRINPYNKFIERFYDKYLGNEVKINSFVQAFVFEKDNLKVGFASFNSSWRSYDSTLDKGRLLIGEEQLNFALEKLADCNIKIAVTHHPLSYLNSYDRDTIKPILFREFNLFLMGHAHEAKTELTHSLSRGLFFSHAPGIMSYNINSDSRNYANGYRIIDYKPIKYKVISHTRRYNKGENRFDPNTDEGDEKGQSVYELPTTDELDILNKQEKLGDVIQDLHLDDFDSQLLSHNTDSIAPQHLSDLFVTPNLVKREEGRGDDNFEQIDITINDIITSEGNFLITGLKESGKTCLLNSLVEKITDDIILFDQIPVKINFDVLKKRRIESEINDFTNVGMSNISDLCQNHNMLLLIDNFKADDSSKRALEKLKRFKAKYNSTRIVATTQVENQDEIPISILKQNKDFDFKIISLRNFKVKQIRSLVENWFKKSDSIKTSDKVDNIVELFKTLSLPRTPLSISILLWIIEKQEDYKPTNESTMLQNFVERVFKKHSESETYSSKFDHKNKTWILASLAVKMLDVNDVSYQLKYSEALIFFEDYIEERQFPFNAQKILDYFIEVGILKKDNSNVRFRFQCFFEYFLMIHMENNDNFREKVLDEKNYLQFSNEIKYYAGIKRDQAELLQILLNRLDKEFSSFKDTLNSNVDSVDEYFQLNNSILDHIDESTFLNQIESNKPTEEDLDQINDKELELNNAESGIKKKEAPENIISRLGKLLNLTAHVLKSSEEITEPGLKLDGYKKVIDAAVYYAILYQFELKRFLEDNSDKLPADLQSAIGFIANYTPTILQLALYSNVGTEKLTSIYESHIEEVLEDPDISNLEKFYSIFIYAENRGSKYPKKISELISSVGTKYIYDNILLKLITYLYLRSESKQYEQKFLNLIAELIVKSKGLPKRKKGEIINVYKRKKLFNENTGSDNQIILEV
jgi:predicted MPP superfamily phosphohydrolase